MRTLQFYDGKSSLQFQDDKGIWHITDSTSVQYTLIGSNNFIVYKTPLI